MDSLTFEYWSDPLCIWAMVAQPKLEQVLERWERRVDVRYRIIPVFGSILWRFREGPWAEKGPAGRAEATRSIAETHGRDDVSGACWLHDCPASSWPACAALKAVFAMEDDEEVEVGVAASYQLAMRRRFFVDAKNVTRRTEQLALAEELALPLAALERRLDDGTATAALWEDHQRRKAMGIQGSPTYVFDGGRAMLYGNFPAEVLLATVTELVGGLDLGGSAC